MELKEAKEIFKKHFVEMSAETSEEEQGVAFVTLAEALFDAIINIGEAAKLKLNSQKEIV